MRSASKISDPLAMRDDEGGSLDLSAIAHALWRRRLRIVVPTLLAMACALVGVHLVTPLYKSTASIFLQSRENAFTRPVGDRLSPDQLAIDEQAVASQVQLLRSGDLAREVIRTLGLEKDPAFEPVPTVGPIQRVLMVLGLADTAALEKSAQQRVAEAFDESLSVYPQARSRVIAVEFSSRDPDVAARVSNGLADAYISLQTDLKRGDSLGASEALGPQIEELRRKVARAEADVEAFRSENGLFLSAPNSTTLTTQQLSEINTQLSTARSQEAEARSKADLISDLLAKGRPLEIPDIANNELIRRLVEQRVNLGAQLALELRTLLPGHPRIKELNAQLADLQAQIVNEAKRAVRSLENDASIAGARVASLANQLDLQKVAMASSNAQEVQLRALERDAKSQRDLLESYLARFREASSRASFQEIPADARIVSRAVAAARPYFPRKGAIVFIVTLIALIGTIAVLVTGELLSGRAYLAAKPILASGGTGAVEPQAADVADIAPRPYDPSAHRQLARILQAPVAVAQPADGPGSLLPIEPAAPARGAADAPPPPSAPVGPAPDAAPETPSAPPAPAEIAGPASPEPAVPVPVPASSDPLPTAAEPPSVADLAAILRSRAEAARAVLLCGFGPDGEISETASALARILADGPLRVILIAARPGRSAGPAGLGDLLVGDASFVDVIRRDRYSRLHLIAAGCPADALDAAIVDERSRIVFDALSSTYDVIILDAGAIELSGERPGWATFLRRCEICALVTPAGGDDGEGRQVLSDWGARFIVAVEPAGEGELAAA